MATTRALDTLHQEHRAITRMLDLFERQLELIEQGREADLDLLKEVVDFFRSYPDLYHHPKEELIARYVAKRDPSAAAMLAEIADEHEAGSVDLLALSRALVDMLMEPETSTRRFADEARSFIAHERQHMAWEDGNFFDIAAATLTEADWAEIDRRIGDLGAPRFEHLARDRFQNLASLASGWHG